MSKLNKMRAFLISKIESGEEPKLTKKMIEALGAVYDDNDNPMVPSIIIQNISEKTLKDLMSFHSGR